LRSVATDVGPSAATPVRAASPLKVVQPVPDGGVVAATDVDVLDGVEGVVGAARRPPALDEHAARTNSATAIARKRCRARSMVTLLTSVYQASHRNGAMLGRARSDVGAVARK